MLGRTPVESQNVALQWIKRRTYLELGPLAEEVFEQHQHVWGHRGHIGGVAIRPLSVAEASAHGIVYKQYARCLHLK